MKSVVRLSSILLILNVIACTRGFKGDEQPNTPVFTHYSALQSDDPNAKSIEVPETIKTRMYVEFIQGTERTSTYNEQEFKFAQKDDPAINTREFALTVVYYPGRTRPISLQLTNMWTPAESQHKKVELDFTLRTEKILSGQTYRCTGDSKSLCNFNQGLAEFRMEIPKGELQCQIRFVTTVNLNFAGFKTPRRLSFPSSHDPEALDGKPLAFAVECTRENNVVIHGFFTHNTDQIPEI